MISIIKWLYNYFYTRITIYKLKKKKKEIKKILNYNYNGVFIIIILKLL